MSVLFKALAKAAKSREGAPPPPIGQAMPASRGRRSSRNRPPIILGTIALLLAAGVGAVFFLEEDEPKLTKLGPPKPKPPGSIGGSAKIGLGTPAPVMPPPIAAAPPTEAPAPAPAPVPSVSPLPAAKPVPSAVAVAPVSPAEPAPPSAPPAAEPAVKPATPPPAAPPAAEPAVKPATFPPAAATPAPVVEADLPAILEGIRRRKLSQSIGQTARVERSSGAVSSDGIAVSVTAPMERDEAKTAYDLLIHGAFSEALQHYDRALKTQPSSVALLLGKGIAEQKMQRLSEARETYRRVLALDGENREALTNMTAILAMGAPEQALGDLRALQHSNPGFSPIPAQIAMLESALGNEQAALTAITAAVQLAPDNALYRLNMAILQDRAGMAAAAESYQAALDLIGPNDALPVPLAQIRSRLRFLQER